MSRWTPVPIVGGAYSDDTKPWSAQDTVNYLPVPAERPGGRSVGLLRDAPGLTTFCRSMQAAPVRGLHNAEGTLLSVTGDTLYRIRPDGRAVSIGKIPGTGRVSMAHNLAATGHDVTIATGDSGYVYNTVSGNLTRITDPGFPGMRVVDFVDGYMVGVEPAGRYWLHSDLRKALEYNTLDRQDAEAKPDRIQTLIVSKREVFVLGRESGQFFRNTGAATGTFQNANGTEMDVGCASPFAVARLDNTVYWLGNDGIVYRLEGNQERRVSVGPVEQAIARCDISKAFAFTFEDRGHKVVYFTFPDGHTWGFDVWSGEFHRRESEGLRRWRLNALVQWNGQWIGGDYFNGRLYRLDWNAYHEAGAELARRRVTGVLHDEGNPVTVNAVRLMFDTGGPRTADVDVSTLPEAPLVQPTLTGNAPDAGVGAVYSYAYALTGTAPLAVSLVSGSLPDGLTLSEAGALTGTLTTKQSRSFVVKVTDALGLSVTLPDSIEVHGVGDEPGDIPPVAFTGSLPDAYVGVPYRNANDALSATGSELRILGVIAPGVTVEYGPEVQIGGVPLEAGSFPVDLAGDNRGGLSGAHAQTLVVAPRPSFGVLDFTTAQVQVEMVSLTEAAFTGPGAVLAYPAFVSGKAYAEFTLDGNAYIGVSGDPTTNGYLNVTGPGTFAVAFDAATGDAWISDASGVFAGDPAAGTGPTLSGVNPGGGYRWGIAGTTGATVEANFGNAAWTYSPPSGFAGVPVVAEPVPARWDTATAYYAETLTTGALSRPDFSGPSMASHDGMRATFGKSAGAWQFEMYATGQQSHVRLGLAQESFEMGAGYGLGETQPSVGVALATSQAEVMASFAAGATLPMSGSPVWTFACDFDAATVAIYRDGTLAHTVTALPAGEWFPAATMSAVGRAVFLRAHDLAHPVGGYADWTVTP